MNPSSDMARRRENRRAALRSTMAAVAELLQGGALDRPRLESLQREMEALAARADIFDASDFPPPADAVNNSNMFELWRSAGNGPTLYASVAPVGLTTPPHNHGTWAVIAGVRGVEEHQCYQRDARGYPQATNRMNVGPGGSAAFLPDEIHSIRIQPAPAPLFSLHLYGLPFEHTERDFFDRESLKWIRYSARPNIRRIDPESNDA